jgi:hypothetical protein
MAIPTSLFQSSAGVALMRQNVDSGEWFFLRWMEPNSIDVHLSNPGPGTWRYAVWLVCGAFGPADSVLCSGGKQVNINVLEVSK